MSVLDDGGRLGLCGDPTCNVYDCTEGDSPLCKACTTSEVGWCPEHPPFKAGPSRYLMPSTGDETEALAACTTALDPLDRQQQHRVLRYLTDRYTEPDEEAQ